MRWLIEIIDNYHNIIITTIIPNNWYSVTYSWSSWFVSIKSIIARLKQHHKQQHRCKTCHGTCPALSATMVTLSSAASSPSENSSSKLYSINPRSILLQKQHHFPKKKPKSEQRYTCRYTQTILMCSLHMPHLSNCFLHCKIWCTYVTE